MRRPVFTYANVMSSVAVVLAMSGTAVAATQISGSTIKDRTVSHKKLVLNTVTGAEVNESSLGRVPSASSASSATNAGKLDGIDSTGFVQGAGVKVYHGKVTALSGTNGVNQATLLTLPNVGRLDVICNGDKLSWLFVDTTSTTEHGTTFSGDNASTFAQYLTAEFGPSSSPNNYMTFFHGNNGTQDALFQDDIAIINSDTQHTSARILLSGVTDVGGTSTCEAHAVATVQ